MGKLGKDFKYKIIKNFLQADELELLQKYVKILHRTEAQFKDVERDTLDTSIYGDTIMEALLLKKRKNVEEESGLKLSPTYSYYRMYNYLSDLFKHKDRPSCEVSVTVCIDSCGTKWPIYMDGTPVHLEKGDAALYLGMDVKHWRDEFQGDYCAQVFLHYVNKEGIHKDWFCDKRKLWGTERGVGK
jgi:hypothetical protein|tara:strand:+ start:269 stop:826 length:558 start_codon:yes stop_codon:yes gene_type:complete